MAIPESIEDFAPMKKIMEVMFGEINFTHTKIIKDLYLSNQDTPQIFTFNFHMPVSLSLLDKQAGNILFLMCSNRKTVRKEVMDFNGRISECKVEADGRMTMKIMSEDIISKRRVD